MPGHNPRAAGTGLLPLSLELSSLHPLVPTVLPPPAPILAPTRASISAPPAQAVVVEESSGPYTLTILNEQIESSNARLESSLPGSGLTCTVANYNEDYLGLRQDAQRNDISIAGLNLKTAFQNYLDKFPIEKEKFRSQAELNLIDFSTAEQLDSFKKFLRGIFISPQGLPVFRDLGEAMGPPRADASPAGQENLFADGFSIYAQFLRNTPTEALRFASNCDPTNPFRQFIGHQLIQASGQVARMATNPTGGCFVDFDSGPADFRLKEGNLCAVATSHVYGLREFEEIGPRGKTKINYWGRRVTVTVHFNLVRKALPAGLKALGARFQGNLSEAETLFFNPVDCDENSLFAVLACSRDELVDSLRTCAGNPADRDFLSEEIEAALMNGSYEGLSGEGASLLAELRRQETEFQRLSIELSHREADFDANGPIDSTISQLESMLFLGLRERERRLGASLEMARSIQTLRNNLKLYAKREEVFLDYLERHRQRYRVGVVVGAQLSLAYKAALLYARLKNITLHLWTRAANSTQLRLKESHRPSVGLGASKIVHLLQTDTAIQPLIDIRETRHWERVKFELSGDPIEVAEMRDLMMGVPLRLDRSQQTLSHYREGALIRLIDSIKKKVTFDSVSVQKLIENYLLSCGEESKAYDKELKKLLWQYVSHLTNNTLEGEAKLRLSQVQNLRQQFLADELASILSGSLREIKYQLSFRIFLLEALSDLAKSDAPSEHALFQDSSNHALFQECIALSRLKADRYFYVLMLYRTISDNTTSAYTRILSLPKNRAIYRHIVRKGMKSFKELRWLLNEEKIKSDFEKRCSILALIIGGFCLLVAAPVWLTTALFVIHAGFVAALAGWLVLGPMVPILLMFLPAILIDLTTRIYDSKIAALHGVSFDNASPVSVAVASVTESATEEASHYSALANGSERGSVGPRRKTSYPGSEDSFLLVSTTVEAMRPRSRNCWTSATSLFGRPAAGSVVIENLERIGRPALGGARP